MEYLFLNLSFIFFFFLPLYFLRPFKSHHVGFRHYPLVGVLPDFIANRHRFLDWTATVLATTPTNTAALWRPGVRGVLTANPANVEHVLKTNFPNYPKGDNFTLRLRDFLGDGIFNSDDELWRHQRKTASYEFNKRSLRNFIVDCVRSEIHNRLLPLLSDAAKSGNNRALDLQDVLEHFAFDNVCKLAFNVDPCSLSLDGLGKPEFMRAFVESTALSSARFLKVHPIIWKIQRFFDIGPENRLRKAIRIVHEFADDITKRRLLEKQEKGNEFNSEEDLLSRFIATDENSPEFLRDIAISFILAGKDTTSSALTWFFWLLSSHPNVTRKIRSEIDQVRTRFGKNPGESFEYDEIREMQYLHAALSEAMRLYPPVPIDTKLCRNDDVLPDGTIVKKGWFVTYHAFAMGRTEQIWGKDCKEFRPERWMVAVDGFEGGSGSTSGGFICKAENPFRYPVFNGGARVCLGREMAYIQMKSIAATMVESFEVKVAEKKTPEYVMSLTLRMKGGLPVKIELRDRENSNLDDESNGIHL